MHTDVCSRHTNQRIEHQHDITTIKIELLQELAKNLNNEHVLCQKESKKIIEKIEFKNAVKRNKMTKEIQDLNKKVKCLQFMNPTLQKKLSITEESMKSTINN